MNLTTYEISHQIYPIGTAKNISSYFLCRISLLSMKENLLKQKEKNRGYCQRYICNAKDNVRIFEEAIDEK